RRRTVFARRCRGGVPVPRQNRVTPFGEIVATPERGTVFANRGVRHDRAGRIRSSWQVKRWLLCLLEFKGRRRPLMTPGHSTELFCRDKAARAGGRPPPLRGVPPRPRPGVRRRLAGRPSRGRRPRRPAARRAAGPRRVETAVRGQGGGPAR